MTPEEFAKRWYEGAPDNEEAERRTKSLAREISKYFKERTDNTATRLQKSTK